MDPRKPPAYWLIRLLPLIAGVMGLAGLVVPGRAHQPLVAAPLLVSALALEFGGWARAATVHGRSLATAAAIGAAAGGALLLVLASSFGATIDPLVALR